MNSLETLEVRAETTDRRLRLLGLRAQISLARGDVDGADHTIRYLEKLDKNPPRRIEWTGSGYVVTGTEPKTGRGWPAYLAWRASLIRSQLHDEEGERPLNLENQRVNFGLIPFDARGNPVFPNDPFLNNNLPDRQPPAIRPGPAARPRIPSRELPEEMPRL
jgi:hypothetical protein